MRLGWLILALCCTSAAPALSDSLAQKPEVAGAIQVLDAWIQAMVTSREEPGLSIGIVYDQNLIWAKGYGFADFEKRVPASPSTLYRIASISKVFTATALMQLRDAGKLRLDDPVRKYLPWFQVKPAEPDAPEITIRELLTHTSGLARELPLPYWNDLKFPSREEMMRLFRGEQAVFPPETIYKYSNLAFAIAGEIVTTVSGEPYAQYVEAHILKPLGMSSTLVVPDPKTRGLAVGYRKRVPGQPREREDFIDARGLTPTAGIASSVEDLARLVSFQFLSEGDRSSGVLTRWGLREMHRVQWLRPDWQNGLGLGLEIRHVGQQVRVGKDGAAPGYKSQIEFSLPDKLGFIVLINGYDADPLFYVNEAFSIMGPVIAKAAASPKPPPAAPSDLSQYVGTYTWKHVDVQVLIIDGQLNMITPDSSNPWDSRVRLIPAGPHTFKMNGGGLNGELLTFELNDAGEVTGMRSASYYRVRKR